MLYVIASVGLVGLLAWCWRLDRVRHEQAPLRGLGDLVAVVLISLGVKGWEGCGCDERRMAWNERWPRRWWLRERLENANRAFEIQTERLEEQRRATEAFKSRVLGFLSIFHERMVKHAEPWYVGNMEPMRSVQELFLKEGMGFRSLDDRAAPSSLADDSLGAQLARQDEAVEPRDYSSRR